MKEGFNFQCWICPKCHDDHRQDSSCSPMSSGGFNPSPDDNSYIAQEYMKLRARLEAAEKENKELKALLSQAMERTAPGEQDTGDVLLARLEAAENKVKLFTLAEKVVEAARKHASVWHDDNNGCLSGCFFICEPLAEYDALKTPSV